MDEYYFARKFYEETDSFPDHTRYSIIQIVKIKKLESFYRDLNELFNLNLKPVFSHLTLFTNSDFDGKAEIGFGINSKEEFEGLEKERI